jgi:hypothetical protein
MTPGAVEPGARHGDVARGTVWQGEEVGVGGREGGRAYKTVMIDQGFCFDAGEWNFPDAPLSGLYARSRV